MHDDSTSIDDLVDYWSSAGPQQWYTKSDAFDADFHSRFLSLHESAAAGALTLWLDSSRGALALLILLDQFPRNCFRGSPRMFATDLLAREYANTAIAAGLDTQVDEILRQFFYLPFEHSEALADQDRALSLMHPLGEETLRWARQHRDIIVRFGRFPHRNIVLGRTTTAEEQAFLDDGGFAG